VQRYILFAYQQQLFYIFFRKSFVEIVNGS